MRNSVEAAQTSTKGNLLPRECKMDFLSPQRGLSESPALILFAGPRQAKKKRKILTIYPNVYRFCKHFAGGAAVIISSVWRSLLDVVKPNANFCPSSDQSAVVSELFWNNNSLIYSAKISD